MDEVKRTPLYELHKKLGAKFVSFAGYSMPVQYTDGVLKEHLHTREYAGFFDVSHMGQITVWPKKGKEQDLIKCLEHLMPCDLVSLPINRQSYSVLTNVQGGVIDDIMIANRGTHYHIVANASQKYADFEHLKKHISDTGDVCLLKGKSLLAIQGPLTESILSEICPETIKMKFLDHYQTKIFSFPCLISRSGYTGEDGFEISIDDKNVTALAQKLFENTHLKPIGLGARDSLRMEAGLCLYGNDLNEKITPPEASLSWSIHKSRRTKNSSRSEFLGFRTILDQLNKGTDYIRVGLLPSGKAPMRQGAEIYADLSGDRKIGVITSGGFSPTLSRPISISRILRTFSEQHNEIFVKVRGDLLPAKITNLPFIPSKYKKNI